MSHSYRYYFQILIVTKLLLTVLTQNILNYLNIKMKIEIIYKYAQIKILIEDFYTKTSVRDPNITSSVIIYFNKKVINIRTDGM